MHQEGALWTGPCGPGANMAGSVLLWWPGGSGGADLSQEEKKSDTVPGLVLVSWGVQMGTLVRNYDRLYPLHRVYLDTFQKVCATVEGCRSAGLGRIPFCCREPASKAST